MYCSECLAVSFQKAQEFLIKMHTRGNILHLLRYTGKTYRDFFSIENADRLLYIAGQNILYWGDSGYQNCLDYTKMDGELQAHKEEILMEYRELLRSFVIASTSSNSAVLPAGGFP